MSFLATGTRYVQNIASTLVNGVTSGISQVGSLFGRAVSALPGSEKIQSLFSRAIQVLSRPQNLTERSVQVVAGLAVVGGIVYAAKKALASPVVTTPASHAADEHKTTVAGSLLTASSLTGSDAASHGGAHSASAGSLTGSGDGTS